MRRRSPSPSPTLLLRVTGTFFLVAFVVGVLLLLADGLPLFDRPRSFAVRLAMAGLLVSLFGAGGIVLTLWAGVRELETIFPHQSIRVWVAWSESDQERADGTAWQLNLRVEDAFVTHLRVEVIVQLLDKEGHYLTDARHLDAHGWVRESREGVWFFVGPGGGPFFPQQQIDGPTFDIPAEAAGFRWIATWWTDRLPMQRSTAAMKVPNDPGTAYPSFDLASGARGDWDS